MFTRETKAENKRHGEKKKLELCILRGLLHGRSELAGGNHLGQLLLLLTSQTNRLAFPFNQQLFLPPLYPPQHYDVQPSELH